MQFLMRRMIIFMGRLVVCNTWVMRYVKGIYLPRYFMFQSMKEIANKKLQKKRKRKIVRIIKVSSRLLILYQIAYHQKCDNDDRNILLPKIPSIRNGKRCRSIPVQLSPSLPTYLPTYPPIPYLYHPRVTCGLHVPGMIHTHLHTPTHISNSSMYLHVGE